MFSLVACVHKGQRLREGSGDSFDDLGEIYEGEWNVQQREQGSGTGTSRTV